MPAARASISSMLRPWSTWTCRGTRRSSSSASRAFIAWARNGRCGSSIFVAKGSIEEGMLSVLAFKRSLSAGILDGGSGEISLGGSRLNRFMKEVENVTGRMGESEAVTPAEEVGNSIVAADDTAPAEDAKADADIGTGDIARSNGPAVPRSDSEPDPWLALAQG